jgi:PAB1-binding protein PBP1
MPNFCFATLSQNSNGSKPAAPANAWATPLQSKRTTAPPPGMGPPTKASVPPSVIFQHRERLLHLSLTLVGQKVVLHQTNGAIVEGIFHTFTPFPSLPADQRNKYVLKEIFMRQQPETESAIKDGITLIIPASKVVFLHAVGIAAELKDSNNMNGASIGLGEGAPSKGAFATDTQISGSAASGRTNELVAAGNAWTAGGNSNGSSSYRNQALGSGGLQATNSRAAALAGNKKGDASAAASDVTGGKMSGSIGQWDQFKANKELFNVNATFDENVYTTQLDTSQLDAKKMAEAERIAKEIENTATKNIHMAEERGFKVETDFDEEDLYSGVLTKDGKQRHEKVTISKKTATEKESKESSKTVSSSTTAVPKKVMNYAAAAAKADANKKKSAPPGFSSNGAPTPAIKDIEKDAESSTPVVRTEKDTKEDPKVAEKSASSKESTSAAKDVEEKAETATKSEKDESSSKDKEASKDKTSEPSVSESENTAEAKEKATEKKTEKKNAKKASKLNANAKSFTFNPSAKTFTPSFTPGATSNPPPQPPQAATADPGMVYGGVHAMQPPHYLQTGPMGQPGAYGMTLCVLIFVVLHVGFQVLT